MAIMTGPLATKPVMNDNGPGGGLGGGEDIKVYPSPKPTDPLTLIKR